MSRNIGAVQAQASETETSRNIGAVQTIPDTNDITPVLYNPHAAATGSTTAEGHVYTDTLNGTLYWVVTTSERKPLPGEVKAGNNHNGFAAVDSGSQAV